MEGEGELQQNKVFSVVGKIYSGILADRVRKMTGGLIDDEQRVFRAGRGCVDQIFILKQMGEQAGEVWVLWSWRRVNRETLWRVLRIYDVDGKLLNSLRVRMLSLAYGRVKGSESECFRIDSGLRYKCIMSPWLFNVYMDVEMKEVKMGMGRRGVRFQEEGRELRLPCLLYAGGMVLCGEPEKGLRPMVRRFVVVCRRRSLKVNAGKSKVNGLGREKGLECKVCVDGLRLEHVSHYHM